MKKVIIVLSILVLIVAVILIPVTSKETIQVKSSFFNTFKFLSTPANWGKWRPDLKKEFVSEPDSILIKKDTNSFSIKSRGNMLKVAISASSFVVSDGWNGNNSEYIYSVIPDKDVKKTSIVVSQKTSAISYLIGKLTKSYFSDTYIGYLKNFLETDSLYYGFNILKIKVPDANLIEIKKAVLKKDQFTEAAKMQASLQSFIKKNDLKKMYPLIAQFFPKGRDSIQVNVGFFVNKEVKSDKDIISASMPKGGPLYTAIYKGSFQGRTKAYQSMNQYFTDHSYQQPILPFECYLDDKLPVSDTSKVDIRINYVSYF
jgi:effector-binding domain-containing protein